jgi:acyl-CoA thioesterase I
MHFRRAGLAYIPLFIAAFVLTLSATLVLPPTATNAQTSAPVRIMPLGDSITTHIPPYNSYRRPLWHMLNNAGYSIDFVGSRRADDYNRLPPNPDFDLEFEGHPGWRVDNILGSIRTWADAYDPDIVLVHLGTNDLIQGQSVDTTVSELGQLIDTLRASNPNVRPKCSHAEQPDCEPRIIKEYVAVAHYSGRSIFWLQHNHGHL